MDLAWISVMALFIVIVLSCTNLVHPGFLAISLAWVIGVYFDHLGPQPIGIKGVVAGFPTDLFLTLTGVGLFFAQAQQNGTLDRIAHAGVWLCWGNVGLIPWMFFFLTAIFAMVGAGNIASAALMAPMAMNVAHRAGIPAALMIVLVGHGAVAGALSPISPAGIIARDRLTEIGVTGFAGPLFWYNLLANVIVAAAGFLIFGGLPLFRRTYVRGAEPENGDSLYHFQSKHWVTLGLIVLLLIGVIGFGMDVGMGAFAAAVILTLARLADDHEAVRKIPWSVILMVCGVTVLTSLLEKTGGTARIGAWIVDISNPLTLPAVFALVAGVVSVYSSTSGVVMPAFLPMIKPVLEKMPGSDPLALACALVVGGHLVDTSPLSTIGALCIAGAGGNEDKQVLFTKVLIWGLAMAVVGAVLSFFLFGLWWPT